MLNNVTDFFICYWNLCNRGNSIEISTDIDEISWNIHQFQLDFLKFFEILTEISESSFLKSHHIWWDVLKFFQYTR